MFYKETAFQETAIGSIPREWECKTISQISEVHRGASPRPIGSPKYFSDRGRGWVRISDVTGTYKYLRTTSQYLSELGETKSVRVDHGDLIMSICATIGRPIIVDMKACIHDGFVVFRNLSSKVNTEFLFYVLQKYEPTFSNMRQTGTQGNLNTGLVGRTQIPLPSLDEQQGIVKVLSCVDLAIQKTDEIIAKTERLKKGLMQQLLIKGIGHKEFKDTKIGKIPKEWETARLGDLILIEHGYAFKSAYFGDKGPIMLTPGNFAEDGGLYFNERNLKRYFGQYPEEFVFTPGDLVVVMTDLSPMCKILGNPAIIPEDEPMLHNQRLGKIVFNSSRIGRDFLYYCFLSYRFKRELRASAAGTTVHHTSPDRILSIMLPLPSIQEQDKIAEILSVVDSKLLLERNEKDKLGRVRQGLMDLLLSGKVRVKVD